MSHTILIVDDSPLMRHSLRYCIEQSSDWQVCGEAENGKVAVEKVKELKPDVVILDLQMPVMNGLEAARHITLLAPNTAMVMFTMHNSEQLLKDAQAAGHQRRSLKIRWRRRPSTCFAEKRLCWTLEI